MAVQNINYKFVSSTLAVVIFFSWTLFGIYYIINGSSVDMIKSQRDEIRRIRDELVTMELKLSELETSTKLSQEKIDSINQARLRDYEFLSSRINDAQLPIKKIR